MTIKKAISIINKKVGRTAIMGGNDWYINFATVLQSAVFNPTPSPVKIKTFVAKWVSVHVTNDKCLYKIWMNNISWQKLRK
jgi:hypothetical protein